MSYCASWTINCGTRRRLSAARLCYVNIQRDDAALDTERPNLDLGIRGSSRLVGFRSVDQGYAERRNVNFTERWIAMQSRKRNRGTLRISIVRGSRDDNVWPIVAALNSVPMFSTREEGLVETAGGFRSESSNFDTDRISSFHEAMLKLTFEQL